jgi:23S rRNA (uridine2552-2'-O)-methyltransferase
VVAIDLLEIEPIANVEFARLDFLDDSAPARLKEMLGGPADVVLCDMAANAMGHRKTDHLKIVALVEAAADFAREVLAPGGSFLAKVIQGGTEGELLAALKRDFSSVKHVKPPASRPDSAELYVLATGLSGPFLALRIGLAAVTASSFARGKGSARVFRQSDKRRIPSTSLQFRQRRTQARNPRR